MTTDNNGKPTEAPAAPAQQARPSALDNLAAIEAEEAAQDVQLAGEIDAAQQTEAQQLLTEAERKRAAAAGAEMGYGFAETLLSVGMKMTKVDQATQDEVAKIITQGRADIVAALGPVLAKHNAEPPAFIANIKEEIAAGFRIIMLVVSIFVAIRDGRERRLNSAANDAGQPAAAAA